MTGKTRDQYLDALRAGALMVVVFGHWLATLPRLQEGRMVDTEHLLKIWEPAGLFVFFENRIDAVVAFLHDSHPVSFAMPNARFVLPKWIAVARG